VIISTEENHRMKKSGVGQGRVGIEVGEATRRALELFKE